MKKLLLLFLILPFLLPAQVEIEDYMSLIQQRFALPATGSAGYLYWDGNQTLSWSAIAASTILPTYETGKYLTNNGTTLSWGALDLSPYVTKDGLTPLTADWNVGAFDLTCVDMNATNFKLSGVGTLTSTLGNVSLTTALTAASGNEAAFTLNYTTNKAAGNDTGLVVNMTDTASPGTSYLQEWYVGADQKAYIDSDGIINSDTGFQTLLYINGSYVSPVNTDTTLNMQGRGMSTADRVGISIGYGTHTQSSGTANYLLCLNPIYNQTSTASAYDFVINRTETAVGSGAQRLLSAQVGSVERFGISNKGFEVRKYPLACTHDTATALFGIAVTAGNTAGGIITYTLNVTDDDGSDDQIEVGTVQFCGLQDEANWHTNISEVSTQAAESGTLATTWAIDTATADTLKVTLQATSNLTTPVYTLSYTVTWNNAYTVTTY